MVGNGMDCTNSRMREHPRSKWFVTSDERFHILTCLKVKAAHDFIRLLSPGEKEAAVRDLDSEEW